MRFVGYRPADVRGSKIDWEAHVDVDDRLRRALHPHDFDQLRVGRLRRPLCVTPVAPGRRSHRTVEKHAPAPAPHKAGALVFAYADESWFLVEASDENE